ncbi:MAG: response regulator [Lachnospiraceae bacterium]|nr:response regulator [Lachnospiraceae bacterium]
MGNSRETNPKEQPSGKGILVIRILFFFVLLLSLAGLLYFSGIDHSDPLEFSNPQFIREWTVTAPDGSVFQAGSSYRNDRKTAGEFTMVSTLPEIVSDDFWFCFINGGDVAVYVGGQLRGDFIGTRDVVIPGGCVKRFYMRVPLDESDSGAEIRIVRNSGSRSGFVYQNTFVADSSAFFNFMISRYGLSALLEIILLVFAAVIVIISVVMMLLYRRRIEMLYGAMSILVIAGWLITNSYLYPFLFGHYHVDGVMNYMLCLMMPFSLVFYLDALQHGRYRNIMKLILYGAAANLLVWPLLHVSGIFSLPQALLIIDAFLGIDLLTVAVILILDFIRGGMKEYKYTAIGLSGFMVCGLGEIVVLNFLPIINGDILMLFGLAFMLSLTVTQQIVDLRKVREEGIRAVDLSEAKTRFLASMSHEIRTPINAILGMNEMILRENKDPVIDEYAGSVKSSGQMLLMLVNDVLDFSKIESGKMEINEAEFTFASLLHSIMPMLQERADEKNLKLRMILLNEVPNGMISDEFRIRQVLINLINNAIKYTDAGSVALMLGGDYAGEDIYQLRMNVKDTGRGISEEDQKNLFDAFTRADIKKNRSIEGTGLGLAIVKSIVDSMGGDISVVSKYGEGSEFIVYLPVRVTDRTPLKEDYEKQVQKTVADDAGGAYTAPEAAILAVDDNSANLKIVRLFLKHVGIVPELCDSGSAAVELCRSRRFDLLLLDHMMPDPDGIRTLEIIRNDASSLNRETPAVVLTANALAGSGKTYADAGFADYLTKPIDSALLEKTVMKYLPAEKILPARKGGPDPEKPPVNTETPVTEDFPVDPPAFTQESETAEEPSGPVSFRERMERIEGMEFETALLYAGGDEGLLKEMVVIISAECEEKIQKMRENMAAEDWDEYSLTAHSIKGVMASVGVMGVSERAKKHEYAATDRDLDFIRSDCEDFFKAYHDACTLMTAPSS